MATDLSKEQNEIEVPTAERTRGGATYNPRIDIWENEEELILHADLPGVAPEDLDIHFENKELLIDGRVARRQKNAEFLCSEYGIGDFHRNFRVGESIDGTKISAELKSGVLTLHLPKVEEVKPRRIEIKAG